MNNKAKRGGKFTQTGMKPDAFVTSGMIEHPIQAFGKDILSGGLPIQPEGYGDNDSPGERHVNFRRQLGANSGPGKLQNFTQKKSGK